MTIFDNEVTNQTENVPYINDQNEEKTVVEPGLLRVNEFVFGGINLLQKESVEIMN